MCQFLSKRRRGDWNEANAAMAAAAQSLEGELDTLTTGEAGILIRPSPDQIGPQAKAEIERALSGLSPSLAVWRTALDSSESPHPWVIVSAEDLPALASSVRAVGEVLARAGLGPRVLAAVYAFRWNERKIYWVYQPRIRAFTPFAPAEEGEDERDHTLELLMEKKTRPDLPTSRNIQEWYPVWGMPL